MRLEMRTVYLFLNEPHNGLGWLGRLGATGAPAGRGPHDAVCASWGGGAERGNGAPASEGVGGPRG